jgi:hypothetical protein
MNDLRFHKRNTVAKLLSVHWVRLLTLAALLLPFTAQSVAGQSASPVYLPLITKSDITCAQNVASTAFGLQLYGDTGKTMPYYKDLIDSSASWVRVYISWATIEPFQTAVANYQWDSADQALGAARDGCLNMLAVIVNPPSFAALNPSIPSQVVNSSKLSDFATFVQALVERYDGDGNADAPGSPIVRNWELFNEPDGISAPNVDNWGDHGTEYAAMLGAAYPVIKAADPQAKVVFGGVAYDWWKETQNGPFLRAFLDDVLKAGGGAHFDVMNYHYYPLFAANWTSKNNTGFLEKAAAVRAKLQSFGLTKPLIVTEMGWHNNPNQNPPSDDTTQIRYASILFVQTMAAHVDYSIWWTLSDTGGDYPDTGLITNANPSVRKAAFSVYYHLNQELRTATFDRALTQAETGNKDMEAYRFVDATNHRSITIAWLNPIKTAVTAKLKLSAASATVRDVFNTATPVTDGQDGATDGKVTATVGGTPVYIEIAQ